MHQRRHPASPAVAALLCAVQWTVADVAPHEHPDLRQVFRTSRCLPEDRKPLYNFAHDRVWLLEANEWASHRLTTLIAAILLREHAGYGVDINLVASGSGVYERLAKQAFEGEALEELVSSGTHHGYMNLEVWASGQRDSHREWVANRGIVQDLGYVGYDGRSGWFVSESFARNPAFATSPEFYRAYDNSTASGRAVLQALRETGAVVSCGEQVCCCGSARECSPGGADDIVWCPVQDGRERPAILGSLPALDQGFNEEMARSNGFEFAIHYMGLGAFATAAAEALSSNDTAQLVHSWKPSLFLTRMQLAGFHPVRVMLPSEECGEHSLDGMGNWSCDFPLQALSKLSSVDALRDPILTSFFRSFSVRRPRGAAAAPPGELRGAGMAELLRALAEGLPNDDVSEVPSPRHLFEVACAWVQSNELSGVAWHSWIQPRSVPFFADTLQTWYSYSLLAIMLALSIAFVIFMEFAWLRTTLSPVHKSRIMSRATKGQCRTELELRLRKETPLIAADMHAVSTGGLMLQRPSHAAQRSVQSMSPSARDMSPVRRLTQLAARPMDLTFGMVAPRPMARIQSDTSMADQYWKGLHQHAFEHPHAIKFWQEVQAWISTAKELAEPPDPEGLPDIDYVSLVHHLFPCFQQDGCVEIPLRRSSAGVASGEPLVVEVLVEECVGGATAKKDFEAGVYKVKFDKGNEYAVFSVRVVHHKDLWQNSVWFKVRLRKVSEGDAMFAMPDEATVLILDTDRWPANLLDSMRGGEGVNLMRYFIRADRLRRGRLWTKTMIAMCWLPVHSVLVSTLVQKVIVDHAINQVLAAAPHESIDWFYWECLILAAVQFISLGLNRWADVVQTRCRGRTGGIRQYHRGELLRKFMHMEHSEHWLASDASWLYSTIYDADVITGEAYFQVFVLAQSIVGLSLSVFLVVILVFWTYLQTKADSASAQEPTFGSVGFIVGVLVVIPAGLAGVFFRRKLLWIAVIARKDFECAWFQSCTWIITNWRYLTGYNSKERAALEKRVQAQNKMFVPAHWDARDTMNDTAWVAHWVQGISYSVMLVFGTFALLDHLKYGVGTMEVGTFYALCKIYLSVGKYVGILGHVFVSMQRAVVSLREIAALLNHEDQRSLRREARMRANEIRSVGRPGGRSEARRGKPLVAEESSIIFAEGMHFVRPPDFKVGSMFSELKLKQELVIPLGHTVFIRAHNERVLRSVLGLASRVIHPTTSNGQVLGDDLSDRDCGVSIPQGLKVMMMPTGSVRMGATAPSIIEQLEFTGAPRDLCIALAESCGLDPSRATDSLGPGSAQVFSIVRALLIDPDVLCTFRPLALVPMDMRRHMGFLMRMWQGDGGLPTLARYLCAPVLRRSKSNPSKIVLRSTARSLIVGNPEEDIWGGFNWDTHINLEKYLWKGDEVDADAPASPIASPDGIRLSFERQTSPTLRVGRSARHADLLDVYGGT